MGRIQKTVSPVDGQVYVERTLAELEEIDAALSRASTALREWRQGSIGERARLINAFVDEMLSKSDAIAEELSRQMGRPIRHTPGELGGFEERARHMAAIAEHSLADIQISENPWNYPLLTAVNAVVPALLAGNTVLLKHSAQTPLAAERFTEAADTAGLPEGVLQHLHLDHDGVARIIGDERTAFVAFTGSVEGGRAVHRASAGRFIAMGLELGGKDPAYVRADAPLAHSVETLVDGSFYNAGQSCCGIERIYVHENVYGEFLDGFVELTRSYNLGNPLDEDTTLGPVVRTSAADGIRAQIDAAVRSGARALIDESDFPMSRAGTPYLAPQVLVDVDHSMEVMTEETFGPVVGIMKVASDEEAVRLMNDSRYGLTAAVFTADQEAAIDIGDQVEPGTWVTNRCDYLDPALAWTGVKDSGRGCTLSRVGYEHLTRPKSYHLRFGV
jgi:acyl-CoA reductase-like NAD-dependent aldehyde dehydrogenase